MLVHLVLHSFICSFIHVQFNGKRKKQEKKPQLNYIKASVGATFFLFLKIEMPHITHHLSHGNKGSCSFIFVPDPSQLGLEEETTFVPFELKAGRQNSDMG